jgi:hypothetical protein
MVPGDNGTSSVYVAAGTPAGVDPGSTLGSEYGGAGNLPTVTGGPGRWHRHEPLLAEFYRAGRPWGGCHGGGRRAQFRRGAGERQRCHYRRPAVARHALEGTAIVLDPAGGPFMVIGPPTCRPVTTASTTLSMRPGMSRAALASSQVLAAMEPGGARRSGLGLPVQRGAHPSEGGGGDAAAGDGLDRDEPRAEAAGQGRGDTPA